MASLARARGHKYGTINVSDTAIALLGDQYRSGDSWHIEELTVNVQHNANNSVDGLLRGVKRRLLTSVLGEETQEIISGRCELQSQRPSKRRTRIPSAKVWIRQDLESSDSSSSRSSILCNKIVRGFLRPRRICPSTKPTTRSVDVAPETPSNGATVQSSEHRLTKNALDPTLPLALLAGLVARNASLNSIQLFLQRMQRDPLFPLVTAVVGYWLMSLYSAIQRQSPSELSGDCIWFEDVYKIRVKIPLACLADADMLMGFFKSHYRNTSAEQFVIDKQYNLFSGNRNGTPTTIEEICSTADEKDIFMAMLYRVSFDSCLNCSNKISPNKFLSEGLQRWLADRTS